MIKKDVRLQQCISVPQSKKLGLVYCEIISHHAAHGWKVPDAAHDGPAAHHMEEVVYHAKRTAVPERITKTRVILPKTSEQPIKGF